MYCNNTKLDRQFMRRMIRADEQDLLQLVNQTPDHPGGDWAKDDLATLEQLRGNTFSSFEQTITY